MTAVLWIIFFCSLFSLVTAPEQALVALLIATLLYLGANE